MKKYTNLVDLVRDRTQATPDKTVFTFLADGETVAGTLTFAELDQQARAIAAQLQTFTQPGDRALVVYPYTEGLEFIAAFFGCLYAGVVAVTDNPPRNIEGLEQLRDRILATQATLILSSQSLLGHVEHALKAAPEFAAQFKALPHLATDSVAIARGADWVAPSLGADTLAFLQHTSGSTGTPKGVRVSHRNLLHNSEIIYQSFEHDSTSQGVMWLPLFHDMGLIGGVIQPLYGGFPVTLMSPISLIQKPVNWLQAISHYRATTSGASNFAYDLLCDKVTPAQRQTLDLSCWTVAFSGAEPIRATTLERFVEQFGPCGFRREAFYPCYGMAETTLFISGGGKADPPIIQHLDRQALEQNQAIPVAADAVNARAVVGCGHAWLGDHIQIIDPQQRTPCPDGQVGEIWVTGAGVGQGYWQQADETEQAFKAHLANGEGPFLRTGDLGFLDEGELFITGRLKDMMILWGRNHYPHQIEATVARSHLALRANHGAAFTVEVDGEDRLVIVSEVERESLRSLNPAEVIQAICTAVAEHHIAGVFAIALLKPASIPKTTSGKVQRRQCRAHFIDGSLNTIADWQIPADQALDITDLMT